jgi:hypothetical protein
MLVLSGDDILYAYSMCRNGDHAMISCYLEVGTTIGGFFINVLEVS